MRYGDIVKVVLGKHKGTQGTIEYDMPGWGKSGQFGIKIGCGPEIVAVEQEDVELIMSPPIQIPKVNAVIQILQKDDKYGDLGTVTAVKGNIVEVETGRYKRIKLEFPTSELRILGQ